MGWRGLSEFWKILFNYSMITLCTQALSMINICTQASLMIILWSLFVSPWYLFCNNCAPMQAFSMINLCIQASPFYDNYMLLSLIPMTIILWSQCTPRLVFQNNSVYPGFSHDNSYAPTLLPCTIVLNTQTSSMIVLNIQTSFHDSS